MSQPIDLGTGRLSWPRGERISDRYGCVLLFDEREVDAIVRDAATSTAGRRGTLSAVVIETRESPHVGDICRGFYPSTPEVGETIVLGKGCAFTEVRDGFLSFGLSPVKDRDSDWLKPKALYRCHNQTVRLIFTPTRATK